MAYYDWQYVFWNLKTTRWNDNSGNVKEIIEVGAVKLDQSLNFMSKYHSYVQPRMCPILSNYCVTTNRVSQEQVDAAPTFVQMLKEFMPWIGVGRVKTISWGSKEKQHFVYNCQMYGKPYKWVSKNVDLKKRFSKITDIERPTFKKALDHLQIAYELDDTSSLYIAQKSSEIAVAIKDDMDFFKKVW